MQCDYMDAGKQQSTSHYPQLQRLVKRCWRLIGRYLWNNTSACLAVMPCVACSLLLVNYVMPECVFWNFHTFKSLIYCKYKYRSSNDLHLYIAGKSFAFVYHERMHSAVVRQLTTTMLSYEPIPPQMCLFPWGIQTPCNTCFLGLTRVTTANGISVGSATFAGLMNGDTRPTDPPCYSGYSNRWNHCNVDCCINTNVDPSMSDDVHIVNFCSVTLES